MYKNSFAVSTEISISDCKVYLAIFIFFVYSRILYSKVSTSIHVWKGLFVAYTSMQQLGPLLCKGRRYRQLKSAYKTRAHTAYCTQKPHPLQGAYGVLYCETTSAARHIRRIVQNVFIIMIILDTILFSSRGGHYMQVEVYQINHFRNLNSSVIKLFKSLNN